MPDNFGHLTWEEIEAGGYLKTNKNIIKPVKAKPTSKEELDKDFEGYVSREEACKILKEWLKAKRG